MRVIYWIAFFAAVWFIGRITNRITCLAGPDHTIFRLELAGKQEGADIIKDWSQVKYHNEPLIVQARLDTYWDFLFIVIYVALIISESAAFKDLEPAYWLNELLRMNILLAILAGVLDYIEDGLILHNLGDWATPGDYLPSAIPAYAKWVLVGWCVLIWLIAIVSRLIAIFRKKAPVRPHVAALNSINYLKAIPTLTITMAQFDIDAYLQDNHNSVSDRVKNAILFTYGDSNPDPSEIEDDRELADLGFGDTAFLTLTGRFNMILTAKKPGGEELDPTDVGGFTTVQDCIDAVTTATT
jgi:hypothetical protein